MDKELQEKKWADKLKLGHYELRNRVCLAALTRQRCDPKDGIPNDLMLQYYVQRSGAGLMLTEASACSQRGQAFPGAGNIYTKEHVEGWKKIVDAVHKRGSKIFIQVFHAGRATHEKLTGGLEVWGPSPIAVRENIRTLGNEPYPVPKQMTVEQIKVTQEEFRKSFLLAKEAGFDGVQLHGAHGYIVDDFLRTCSNQRKDEYGGSAENRCRFALEIVDLALQVFQPWQLGMKISPVSRLRDQFDENPLETYSHLLKELNNRNIGFVEMRESCEVSFLKSHYEITPPEQLKNVCEALKPFYKGLIIANDSFTPESGISAIRNGLCDMISFGRLYVSTPDLAERILQDLEVNKNWDFATFYGHHHGAKGYTDYPFMLNKKKDE